MTSIWNQTLNLIALLAAFPLPKAVAELLLSSGEVGLLVSSLAVVIGLVGEYRIEKTKDRWQPESLKPEGWNWRRIWAVVIVAGIVVEFVSDAAIWRSSDSLQAISDLEIEKLRSHNLALEQILKPRRLLPDGDAKKIAEAFVKFASLAIFRETRIYVQAVPDFEAEMLQRDIVAVTERWGWWVTPDPQMTKVLVQRELLPPGDIPPGVAVLILPATGVGTDTQFEGGHNTYPNVNTRLFAAGYALAAALAKAGLTEGSLPTGPPKAIGSV